MSKENQTMKLKIIILIFCTVITSCKTDKTKTETIATSIAQPLQTDAIKITPISHATAVIEFDETTIYIDPTKGANAFQNYKNPDFVVITDIHGDHMNLKTLRELDLRKTTIIAPNAVAKEIRALAVKEVIIMNNNDTKTFGNFSLKAVPMYNLREEALKYHQKGRGNGYVFRINNKNIYFSGDTEDIPEMRALKDIDKAFVCMNLPYTMTVTSAADAVLAFQPK